MHRHGMVAVVFALAVGAILGGVEARAQTIEFVPTGSTGPFEIKGNEIIIPVGGLQVELEVLLSGWGNAPGTPQLGAFNATLEHDSLLGASANPPDPGMDLTTPNAVSCPGDDASLCPVPSPPPVTVTGGCGTFELDRCDDFVAAFAIVSQCFGAESVICSSSADCPSPANPCVSNPNYPMPPLICEFCCGPVCTFLGEIAWVGLAGASGVSDDGTRKHAGMLRLIVPPDAQGSYTVAFKTDPEKTFMNDQDGLKIPGLTIIPGRVTILGDCNDNGVTDDQDIANGTSKDCNGNIRPDECDIAGGSSTDCNANNVPDECDLATGAAPDCNGNDVPDECDIADGFSEDCNENNVPDECDIAGGTSQDCTGNGVPDLCEADCNDNRVADSCEIADGATKDCNGNGVPDECDAPNETGQGVPTIEFVPTGSGGPFALGCNEIVIPFGGVQVELEVLLSGWGNAPGSPMLLAYNATLAQDSLWGTNADPPEPGIDLILPISVDCPGDDESPCPDPSPPPVTMTGTCGVFEPGKCDDFQAAFIIANRCFGEESVICASSADCPSPANPCVANPDYVLPGGCAGPCCGIICNPSGEIDWTGVGGAVDRPDEGRRYHAGMLRLIVPASAKGTYTIAFQADPEKTFLNDTNGFNIPNVAIIAGQVTIASACCLSDGSCDNLTESDCALAGGTSLPDLCGDNSGGFSCRDFAPKNRYISFMPDAGSATVAYRVDLIESELFPESVGLFWWVDVPNERGIARLTGEPVFHDWSGDRALIDVGDCPIVPGSVYEIRATTDGIAFSGLKLASTTARPAPKDWADVAGARSPLTLAWGPPDGLVNINDVLAVVATFLSSPGAPPLTWVDLDGERPNGLINVTDLQDVLLAFILRPYPFSAPADCP